jgi:ribose/xylose/arabinose/galactoside ABC-type transport system permease subunit
MFDKMAEEEIEHRGLLLDLYRRKFGDFLALIRLAKTQYGHLLYAVGGNVEISLLFGIPVRLVVSSTYVFSGLCVGTAASLATSQLSYSASDQDPVLVFDVIVAVVVGGTSLAGGIGSMWQTAVGLAILAVLQNGLNSLDISTFYQYIIKGCLIIGAVSLDVWIRWLPGERLRQTSALIRRTLPTGTQRASQSSS